MENCHPGHEATLLSLTKKVCTEEIKNQIWFLLKHGSDVNERDVNGNTPLMNILINNGKLRALEHSKPVVEVIKIILNSDTDVTIVNKDKENVIHLCARFNLKYFLKLILSKLSKSVRLATKNKSGQTPLHIASHWNNIEIVRILVEHQSESDINLSDGSLNTPLHLACGDLKLMKYLIYHGANPCLRNKEGNTALLNCKETVGLGLLKFLQDNSDLEFQVNVQNGKKESFLHTVCRSKHLLLFTPSLDIVIPHVKNINVTNIEGQTPLMLLPYHGFLNAVKKLLDNGADPNIEDKQGNTVFDFAFRFAHMSRGHRSVVKYFVENYKNNFLKCSLWKKNGIHCFNKDGFSLFHYACLWSNLYLVKLLISRGFNIFLKTMENNDPKTALGLIQEQLYLGYDYDVQIIYELIKMGMDINEINKTTGQTLLHSVCFRNYTCIAKYDFMYARVVFQLLNFGCRVNIAGNHAIPLYHVIYERLCANNFNWLTDFSQIYEQILGMLLSAGSELPLLPTTIAKNTDQFLSFLLVQFEKYGHQTIKWKTLPGNEKVTLKYQYPCVSLKALAANKIRTRLQPNSWVGVANLILPNLLKEYVRLGFQEFKVQFGGTLEKRKQQKQVHANILNSDNLICF